MKNKIVPGIPDEEFIRNDSGREIVPMTKEEIRIISLSKLRLEKDSILLDIGAGTGSISIEAALILENGKVFAVEQNKEAVDLINENIDKFNIKNIEVIHGIAPVALEGINFNKVFIGGSGGNLEKILQWINERIPENGIIVANAITLETMETVKNYFVSNAYDIEIIQVAITKGKKLGKSIMMKSLNPVFIIKGKKNSR